ncbi:SusC/RagA family TonB-linked outer membrane protein [Pontibacter ramchanderi]|uniref:Iron complex outermembrane receptor protein n=1 Tax=Pontibacter ramchanderi TaxID=1179743 RepID=A0A2N3V397_9BACT|nr:TonB-dependent receptor [Pontibacter ramchanderi]PKV76097.1 iron complex outermembrane receptor protein [Pontibacter ramchanderi]
MSNKSTKRLGSLGLAVALCCFQVPGTAQGYPGPGPNLAVNHTSGQALTAKSLKDLLNDLKNTHGIQFSYQASLADDLQLIVQEPKSGVQNVDEFLGTTLASNNLAYKKVRGVYIISKAAQPAPATTTAAAIPSPSAKVRQDQAVSGRVTDENGSALPGVTVVLKGTTRGTATNANGEFTLPAPAEGGTLVFSYIGYATQEVVIGGQTNISITMRTDARALQEVVVVGYGTQERKDVTGAVTTISEEDFQDGQVTTAEQLITGKVAGVQITSNGGAPGAGSRIRIRGGASLNASNDPLIVIDGVPIDNQTIAGSANPLNFINPDDIASMNILKDASATAIYGSRASNGVIIITTKRGQTGQKTRVNFSTLHSLSTNTKQVDVMDADEFRRTVIARGNQEQINLLGTENTNWQDQIYRNAYTTDNNVSVSGAVKELPYRVSLGYLNQDGVLKTSSFERVTGSIKLTPTFLDNHLSVDVNWKGALTNSRFAEEGAIGAAVGFDPTQPVYSENNFGGYFEWLDPTDRRPITIATRNPLSMLEQRRNEGEARRSIGNIQLDYKFHFLPELRANLNVGYDKSDSEGNNNAPVTLASESFEGGSFQRFEEKRTNKLLDYYMNYTNDFEGLRSRIDVTGGYSYQDWVTERPAFPLLRENGDVRRAAAPFPFKTQNTLVSFFGRVNYALMDRYILTATVRRDGSSRFRDGQKWGTFPSLAFAWRINEEAFLRDNPVVSDLKLRVGYGVTGQQDVGNDFPYLARYTSSDSAAMYQIGNQYYLLLRPEGYDANLKWEETKTWNAGIDFGFLNNRLYGSLDAFQRNTKDLLSVVPVPAGTNLTNLLLTNVGSIESKGLEAVLNYVVVDRENFTWSVGINGSVIRNKITKLNTVDEDNSVGVPTGGIAGATGRNIQVHTVGYAPNTFYVYKQVYGQDGRPIEGLYADLNQDGIINEQDKYRYKNPNARLFSGFNTQLNYNNWSLGLLMRGNFNNYVYNNVHSNTGAYEVTSVSNWLSNMSRNVNETGFNIRQYESDYYIENASFVRMENISLGYNFGRIMNDRAALRLNANIQNAFVITDYKGLDPEIASGIDNNFYPRPRVFSLGLNLEL